MKAFLILCILFASILFFPSSLLARELAAAVGTGTPATGNTGNSGKPTVPCKGGKGNTYNCQPGKPKRPPPCNSKYSRHCPSDSGP
ncbi:hypothetical protein TIFTF001_049459 [Ficus carica]|uniref:Rapid ALkalinization Factor n=1 Tax=Ficus carica TaxID=3494 RepID=A0AA88CME9_FICCA|nr:hypothetical protein TIFTF001_040202 [Ficus carica]GMN28544.1 hypothetical protein TIFTF001_049459 [Ficus carica]